MGFVVELAFNRRCYPQLMLTPANSPRGGARERPEGIVNLTLNRQVAPLMRR